MLAIGILGGIGIYFFYKINPNSSSQAISDEKLLKYAKSSFDKKKMMFKDFILGYHNNAPVRVHFPCSDICPDYTTRIIRYDVSPSECNNYGGEMRSLYVPAGPALIEKEFCFPKVIIDAGIYNFAEK